MADCICKDVLNGVLEHLSLFIIGKVHFPSRLLLLWK